MARLSVDEIQGRIAAVVDQDESTSNISSTDYSLRLKYINMALHEWQETYDWQTLLGEYNCLISTSTGNASIAMPTDYRKLAGPVQITWDGSTTDNFVETRLQEDVSYSGTYKRISILGNPKDQYVMRVFGVTLASGASVKFQYFKSIQSLVSPANIMEIPNAEYITARTIAYIWESREDPRYPGMEAKAERLLRNMIEYENVFGYHSNYDRVKTVEETNHSFRLGRD